MGFEPIRLRWQRSMLTADITDARLASRDLNPDLRLNAGVLITPQAHGASAGSQTLSVWLEARSAITNTSDAW